MLTRNNLAAFDATTGAISTTFVPNPDGEVTTIIPSGDGSTVYIGGYFNNVSGAGSPSTARINATTGARITTFKPPKLDGRIKDMRLVGNRLWLAGYFTTVQNQPQVALATVNATTGAFDPFMGLSIAGVHNGGVTTVMKLDVTPDGSELVAIGNFNDIEGVQHHQVFMLNLTGTSAAVENWQTNFYNTGCSGAFQTYMRDLDISPDGSYFVISTTGAYGGANVSCDSTVALGDERPRQQPELPLDRQHRRRHDVRRGCHRHRCLRGRPPTLAEQPVRGGQPGPRCRLPSGDRGARPGERSAVLLEPDPRARCRRLRPVLHLDRPVGRHRTPSTSARPSSTTRGSRSSRWPVAPW